MFTAGSHLSETSEVWSYQPNSCVGCSLSHTDTLAFAKMTHVQKVKQILPEMMADVADRERREAAQKGTGPAGIEHCDTASMAQGTDHDEWYVDGRHCNIT